MQILNTMYGMHLMAKTKDENPTDQQSAYWLKN